MTGQDYLDRANYRLAGYANSVNYLALLDFVNEAANEVWVTLKNLRDDYFLQFSQNTDSTSDYYFPPLVPNQREYDLPPDFKEMRFIEPTSAGYTDVVFEFRPPIDPEFRQDRQDANSTPQSGLTSITKFLYTITGTNKLILASYLPLQINVTLWYIRGIPRFEANDPVPDIIDPYATKAVEYAAKIAMLANQDVAQFQVWKEEWRNSVIMIAQGAAPRNASDPTFATSFGSDDVYGGY